MKGGIDPHAFRGPIGPIRQSQFSLGKKRHFPAGVSPRPRSRCADHGDVSDPPSTRMQFALWRGATTRSTRCPARTSTIGWRASSSRWIRGAGQNFIRATELPAEVRRNVTAGPLPDIKDDNGRPLRMSGTPAALCAIRKSTGPRRFYCLRSARGACGFRG